MEAFQSICVCNSICSVDESLFNLFLNFDNHRFVKICPWMSMILQINNHFLILCWKLSILLLFQIVHFALFPLFKLHFKLSKKELDFFSVYFQIKWSHFKTSVLAVLIQYFEQIITLLQRRKTQMQFSVWLNFYFPRKKDTHHWLTTQPI